MIDLIDRLRSKTPNMTEGHAAMEEAAATIEALRARVVKADELALCAEEMAGYFAEFDGLRAG